MWPYPINWLNVPRSVYKICIQGASHELEWIPFELPCPMKCAKFKLIFFRPEETQIFCPMKCTKLKLFFHADLRRLIYFVQWNVQNSNYFFQAWGDSCILPNEVYKIEIIFFRPEETQMSSDEFRVTQHVMKTIKDEMPAIVRSMVNMFWFFHCSVSAFELRVFL